MSRKSLAFAGLVALAAPALAQPAAPALASVDPAVVAVRERALADETAWQIVEGLTTEVGPRPDGSAQEARARDWAVARLKALGFANVHVEPYQVPTWQRGVETAEVISPFPQPLRLTALGNSGATPAKGVTLPVVAFATVNDLAAAPDGSLAGRIAYVSNAMPATQDGTGYGQSNRARLAGPSIAATKGAAAIVIKSIGTDHGRGPHTGVTDFAAGVTPIPAAALAVSDALNLERMLQRGRPVTLHLTLTPRPLPDQPSGNVVAEIPGSDPAAGIVLIGGHLDSWDLGTGAIDDGAGIAITTAAARLVMQAGRPRRTIRIVWFGDEETGGFGGIAYQKAHATDRHVVATESDFGADRVWRVAFDLPDAATPVADRIVAALTPLGIVRAKTSASAGTDVDPVVATGVGTVAMNQDGTRYFDYHHTPEDTLEIIDPAQLKQNVAAWAAMLAVVANAPEDIGPVTPKK